MVSTLSRWHFGAKATEIVTPLLSLSAHAGTWIPNPSSALAYGKVSLFGVEHTTESARWLCLTEDLLLVRPVWPVGRRLVLQLRRLARAIDSRQGGQIRDIVEPVTEAAFAWICRYLLGRAFMDVSVMTNVVIVHQDGELQPHVTGNTAILVLFFFSLPRFGERRYTARWPKRKSITRICKRRSSTRNRSRTGAHSRVARGTLVKKSVFSGEARDQAAAGRDGFLPLARGPRSLSSQTRRTMRLFFALCNGRSDVFG